VNRTARIVGRTLVYMSMIIVSADWWLATAADAEIVFTGERKRNNLVSDLLEVVSVPPGDHAFQFTRPREGWIFVSATCTEAGKLSLLLDGKDGGEPIVLASVEKAAAEKQVIEAVRCVSQGPHTIRLNGDVPVEKLEVRAIPDLVHSGLFNPAIKSYGPYDMQFLRKDVLPNITGLIVPSNIQLSPEEIDDWHRQGKMFIAEVGRGQREATADDLFQLYSGFFERMPFLDAVIINEFGMNREPHPERRERAAARHRPYEEAFRRMRADDRYKDKTVYNYFGGSANLVNFDDTGETFCRTLVELNYPIALERYLFERSSEQGSVDALQKFIDGISDWEAKVPGAKRNMLLSFGLFNAPPGGINKLPNVDYHVWMDQQMNVVATHTALADVGGINWWTSSQADEDSVRFVGQLYRHYGIEGRTDRLTRDPLFTTHLQYGDFEKELEGWTLHAAEEGNIDAKSFPRYGRIEGRYMGLGRPADPEHIGDTFLWMKRSAKGPNTFSQTIQDLEPGRLYLLKMFTCDYRDLVEPQAKTPEQANRFRGQIAIDGVEVDRERSFREAYSSNPEPPIPVWITYHWTIFRATATTAQLTVSDWDPDESPDGPFGQEQTFNFLELQPYRE
jgi:hypothetical protein